MRFKQINQPTDVKRIIKADTMVNAPIDDKNIMTDWIEEDVFDSCANYKSQYTGFIDGIPTYLKISGNCMLIQPVGRNIDSTTDAIILGRFGEILNHDDDGRLDDDSEVIAVCETEKRRNFYFVSFYYGRYIGK